MLKRETLRHGHHIDSWHCLLWMKMKDWRKAEPKCISSQLSRPDSEAIRHKAYNEKQNKYLGIPWQASGWDSTLPLPRIWVQSPVRELRPYNLCSKKRKNEDKGLYFLLGPALWSLSSEVPMNTTYQSSLPFKTASFKSISNNFCLECIYFENSVFWWILNICIENQKWCFKQCIS